MKKLGLLGLIFLVSLNLFAQISLNGSPYVQNFDNLGSGLPVGWTVKTAASATNLGTDATLVTSGSSISWSSSTGNFRNAASFDGLTSSSSSANQLSSSDRVLALRPTGSFGDPGGAFVLELNNTIDYKNLILSFKLQSLDVGAARTSSWKIDYGLGPNPTQFYQVASVPSSLTTGNSSFESTNVSVNFPLNLNNYNDKIYIRILSLNLSTGSGSRTTTGIDDVTLSYETISTSPQFTTNLNSFNNFTSCLLQNSDPQSFIINGVNLISGIQIAGPTQFEFKKSTESSYSNPLTLDQINGNVETTTINVRLKGEVQGQYNGNLEITSNSASSLSIPLNGEVDGNPIITTGVNSLSMSTCPAAPSSYRFLNVSGNFLNSDLVINAPQGFYVSPTPFSGPWTKNYTFVNTSCKFQNTIYVRLDTVANGSYTGNLTINSTGVPTKLVSLIGSVGELSIANNQKIRIARDNILVPVSQQIQIAGRVTAVFGSSIYLQDSTGGMPVFNLELALNVAPGDSVWVQGTKDIFNGQRQLSGYVCYKKIAASKFIPEPKLISFADYGTYEGQLVKINNVSFMDTSFVFISSTNYKIKENTNTVQKDVRIDLNSELVGHIVPNTSVSLTGVMGFFQNASGSTQTFQLYPRFESDINPRTLLYENKSLENYSLDSTLEIMSWNIEWFGNSTNGPTNELTQFANAKTVVDSLKPDILVLEEISNIANFQNFINQLPQYSGSCSPYGSNMLNGVGVGTTGHPMPIISMPSSEDHNQRICVIYKNALVTKIEEKVLMRQVLNIPDYPDDYDNFWASGRYPYMWVLDATINGNTKRFHVVGIHAKANTEPTDISYLRRKYDINVLKDTLDAQYPDANIIMLGDYNDDVDVTVANVPQTESTYKVFEDDLVNYKTVTKNASLRNFRSYLSLQNVIDHITISKELFGSYIEGSGDLQFPFKFIQSYTSSTSDHIPVMASFDLRPCITNVVINNVLSNNNTILASETISSNRLINQKARILFDAKKSILLSPGFMASGDVVFKAKIGGCSN